MFIRAGSSPVARTNHDGRASARPSWFLWTIGSGTYTEVFGFACKMPTTSARKLLNARSKTKIIWRTKRRAFVQRSSPDEPQAQAVRNEQLPIPHGFYGDQFGNILMPRNNTMKLIVDSVTLDFKKNV